MLRLIHQTFRQLLWLLDQGVVLGEQDLNSLNWINKIKVLGTTALQISEKEAEKSPELLRECFKHSVNRQIFANQLKKDIASYGCVRYWSIGRTMYTSQEYKS